jgi:uncharacterized repeat protein (TIGR03806 family)
LGVCAFWGHAQDDARPYGIESRVPLTTSRFTGSPDPPLPYRLERTFENLSFSEPVTLTNAPRLNRLFVVELNGRILSFPNDPAGDQIDLFVDLSEAPQNAVHIYGFTFHLDFPSTPYCYICYTVGENIEDGTRLSRFLVEQDSPPRVVRDSEQLVLSWLSGGHNGGCLKFGPDGYLYISTGDGGPAFPPDPLRSGQDVSNLLSAILRIDVNQTDDDRAYSIPASNPFVENEQARGEIWAYGLRNPWRMSFDSLTGDLWVGDVGWEMWELIYRVRPGDNYGWSIVEGPQAVHLERPRGPTPIVPPTAEHSHIEARSVTGGFVYRGDRLEELYGAYIYGDYVTGKLWALRYDGSEVTESRELLDTNIQIICFGVDNQQELYIVGYDGTIHRLVANETAKANVDFPRRLSETGLFDSVAEHRMSSGVLPYSVNAEPWMDGAVAERFLALPGTSTLGMHDENDPQQGTLQGQWKYPRDAVLLKTISLPLDVDNRDQFRRLETQVLHLDGEDWRAYSYIWNDEQTDAELAPNTPQERTFTIRDRAEAEGRRQQTWRFSSRTECFLCHTSRGGFVYGFRPAQLNRDHDYGGIIDDQLRTLEYLDVFETLAQADKIADPYDETSELNDRARAYLHVNCSHCHRRGGGGTAAIELEYRLSLDDTRVLGERPTQGTFGIHGAQVVAPGDPYRSVLYYRVAKLGRGRMPYVGSSVVDDRGVRLMHRWIEQLDASASPQEPTLRSQQNEALARFVRPGSTESEATAAIELLLSSTSGALMMLHAMTGEDLSDATRAQAISLGTTHPDVQIRELFERYIPEPSRIRRLGRMVDPTQILALTGNAERGKQLFEDDRLQCRNCHRYAQTGKELGPDLSELAGKQTPEQILQSILVPSRNIDPKYAAHLVETTGGQVFVGLLMERSDREVVLRDAQNKEIRVATKDIEFSSLQQKSLMPELLVQDMTAQDVADLLRFLSAKP